VPAKPRVEIEGLALIQKKLRELDPALAKELKDVNLSVADLVADIARNRVPIGKTGNARASVKAKGEQRYAVIRAGGRKAPYYPWLDFGGRRGQEKKQSRPYVDGGRFIYPVVGAQHEKIVKEYVVMLGQLLDKAGL
jgi:hypothetical protein